MTDPHHVPPTARSIPSSPSAALEAAWGGSPRTVTRGGSLVRYWSVGDEEGPAVVCTHGATLDHGAFDQQVPDLVEAGYRVITWDLSGHGASRPMDASFSLRSAADDLGAVLDAAGVDEAVLVGQSFGGLVAQQFNLRYPWRVSAMVLVGSPPLHGRPPWYQRLLGRIRPGVLRIWPEQHLRRVLPSFMSQRLEVRAYVADVTASLSKTDLIVVTRAALGGLHAYDRQPSLHGPVLLVHGDGEQAMVQRMMEGWADADELVFRSPMSGAGHLANQDVPSAFNELLLTFLSRYRPSARGSAALEPSGSEPASTQPRRTKGPVT